MRECSDLDPEAVLRVSFLRGFRVLRVNLRRTDLCLLVEEKAALGVAARVQKGRDLNGYSGWSGCEGNDNSLLPKQRTIQRARAEVF